MYSPMKYISLDGSNGNKHIQTKNLPIRLLSAVWDIFWINNYLQWPTLLFVDPYFTMIWGGAYKTHTQTVYIKQIIIIQVIL